MAVFLRILLSVALVLNGTSSAWAMQSSTASASASVMHAAHEMAAEAAEPPCHEHAEPAPVAPEPAPMPDDCCQTDACQCACAHLPAAAFAIALALPAPMPGTVLAARTPGGHAAPALPHQIRPPIV